MGCMAWARGGCTWAMARIGSTPHLGLTPLAGVMGRMLSGSACGADPMGVGVPRSGSRWCAPGVCVPRTDCIAHFPLLLQVSVGAAPARSRSGGPSQRGMRCGAFLGAWSANLGCSAAVSIVRAWLAKSPQFSLRRLFGPHCAVCANRCGGQMCPSRRLSFRCSRKLLLGMRMHIVAFLCGAFVALVARPGTGESTFV